MAYQSKAEELKRSSYRFTHRLYTTVSEIKENPYTGVEYTVVTRSENPRPAALYNTTMTSTVGIAGYDANYDYQFAVRKIANDPLDSFNLDTSIYYQIDDDTKTKYKLKNIQRATEPNGYHVLTLTSHLQA
ncbi:hypothetical protein [Leuconostoc lactis]|uniref:hypothetical protein n=1 Tax=Leuconostoc lactis TaxID=1246 RepID=UPI0024ADF03A|nr:hypothetical protein [Leuconostoc lactis]MDI6574122.1 hypothetical protein [Leuconostoc lactis]